MAFFRAKILLPVVLAVFCTPIPTKLGLYMHVFGLFPVLAGLLPCQFPNGEADWGFTFEDLYGGGDGGDDGEASDEEKRAHRNRLWGQRALVTGANSGTGYEVSLALARLGVRVTMACRNPKKCRAAARTILEDEMVVSRGGDDRGLREAADREAYVTTMTVDTSSLASVKKFCGEFLERGGGKDPLDMLFLNAGIGQRPLTPEGTNQLSEDGIEIVFATNVVGHHLMYKLLEPAITANSDAYGPRITPARIVLTSSAASYDTLPQRKYGYTLATDLERLNGDVAVGMSHYVQSKLAQVLWARELTARLDTEGDAKDANAIVHANAAHPGAVATNIWMGVVDTEREAKVRAGAGTVITEVKKSLFEWWMKSMWTPEEGALTLVYLGTAVEELRKKNIRGKYFHPQSQEMTVHRNVYANEDETNVIQAKLWKFLDELVADFV